MARGWHKLAVSPTEAKMKCIGFILCNHIGNARIAQIVNKLLFKMYNAEVETTTFLALTQTEIRWYAKVYFLSLTKLCFVEYVHRNYDFC